MTAIGQSTDRRADVMGFGPNRTARMSRSRQRHPWVLLGVFCLLAGVLTVVPPARAGAATSWYVAANGDDTNDCLSEATACGTINGTIAKATDGDTVLVLPGTYVENIWTEKGLILESTDGAEVTFVDGGGMGTVVGLVGSGKSQVLRGFTIRNGYGPQMARPGGVMTHGNTALIEDNIIVANSGSGDWGSPGGIFVDSGTIVRSNIIADNHGWPGGVFSLGAEISGNLITRNSGSTSGPGGLLVWAGVISGNVISHNTGVSAAGGIELDGEVEAIVANNLIFHNTGDSAGGIEWGLNFGSIVTVINNTIAFNESNYGFGDAITAFGYDRQVQLTNNILIGDGDGPVVGCDDLNDPNDLPVFTYNNIYSGGDPTFFGICTDPSGTDGNISVTPMFVAPTAGDYHLNADSPGIDAGTNVDAPLIDFDGDPRPIDGDSNGVAITDMGFDEFIPTITTVDIDIKPDSGRNRINLKSKGRIPVALLGSATFDVATVDVSTLAFGPAGARPVHDGYLEDVNNDGFLDLLTNYRTQETGILPGGIEACLTGKYNGSGFEGCDAIVTVPRS